MLRAGLALCLTALVCNSAAAADAGLVSWLESHSVPQTLELTSGGAFARGEIEAGEEILSVPVSIAMSAAAARASPLGVALANIAPPLTDANMLAVYLIDELRQGSSSQWSAWLSTLPAVGSSGADSVTAYPLDSAMFWSDEDMEDLRGSGLHTFGSRRAASAKTEHTRIVGHLSRAKSSRPESGSFTLDQFKHASALVMGHSVLLPSLTEAAAGSEVVAGSANAKPVLALVPGLEYVRHSSASTAAPSSGTVESEVRVSEGSVRIYTHTAFSKGSEVLFHRGDRGNGELLLNCGPRAVQGISQLLSPTQPASDPAEKKAHMMKVTEKIANVHDAVTMYLSSSNADLFELSRRAILQDNGLPSQYSLTRLLGMPATLMRAMRILNLRPDQLHMYKEAFGGNGLVNMDNEYEALRALRNAFVSMMSRYTTTHMDDSFILAAHLDGTKPMKSARQMAAVVVRRGEKEVLLKAVAIVDALWMSYMKVGLPKVDGSLPKPVPVATQ